MNEVFEAKIRALINTPKRWLVTGAAGFIGSNIVEFLLSIGQEVVGLDNFSSGSEANLVDVCHRVGAEAFGRFRFITGDIRDITHCRDACLGVDFLLHHAALVSVPHSVSYPVLTDEINVGGFVRVLEAARLEGVKQVVYASSSAVYGNQETVPNRENMSGCPLSPYALSKQVNEGYASLYSRQYGLPVVGLRYFNVFGRRQDPGGAYAAVIPKWVTCVAHGQSCIAYGDGTSTRDFCHVHNVIQANILAVTNPTVGGEVFNVGTGYECSLLELHRTIGEVASLLQFGGEMIPLRHEPPRAGDIHRSVADISKIQQVLGYVPKVGLREGLHTII